ACVGAALWISVRIRRRLHARGRGAFAIEWATRVAWPLAALALLLIARAALSRFLPIGLMSVAIALLGSLVVIRTIVLVLRQTFRQAQWMATFERSIAGVIWVLVALHILDLLPVLVDTLESIAIPLGKSRLTLLQLVTGVVTLAIAGLVALWASNAIDARLAGIAGVDQGARAVIGRIAQPLLLLVALLIALPIIGLDLTTLSVFGGALGVGLGLGLQRIAANYVSGFIILLDKSIQPGRMIRVGQNRGTVADIRTRYTVLRGGDGVDSIVPNEMLVSSVVESETFTNTLTRATVQVGVAYGSDVERAMALMVDAARAQPRVLQDPAPAAFLVSFGDSAILLECGFWVADPQLGTQGLRSDMNLAILRTFREAGIDLPFPQREVTLRGELRTRPVAGPDEAAGATGPTAA
ncbi:MAG TPA: mechanosensitive ion channel domain-containing protein, partial [Burkholderiaceae bacterium]|nr:mechanosensitive ion channel domain-containing protein [Burkholderiaceae bacterium]